MARGESRLRLINLVSRKAGLLRKSPPYCGRMLRSRLLRDTVGSMAQVKKEHVALPGDFETLERKVEDLLGRIRRTTERL